MHYAINPVVELYCTFLTLQIDPVQVVVSLTLDN